MSVIKLTFIIVTFTFSIFLPSTVVMGQTAPVKRPKYAYVEREYSTMKNLSHIGGLYILSWMLYPAIQHSSFKEGSFDKYKSNFGKLTFDRDGPFWNFIMHPFSGNAFYLYFRSHGHSRASSLMMSFFTSALFEFTIEVYTEPASVQDLYQTPILGSILGLGIENVSLYLLNTETILGEILGHLINPFFLLQSFQEKVIVAPIFNSKQKGLILMVKF